jgi:hypothetical protein
MRGLVLIGVGLLALACGEQRASPAPALTAATAEPPVVVTRSAADARDHCRPRAAARAVLRFLAEARAGRAAPFDFEALDGWYSVTSGVSAPEGASATVTDRDALQRYLTARREQHERYRLRVVRTSKMTGGNGGLEVALRRRADDLARGRWVAVEGKGAIGCVSGTLLVWSMSSMPEDERVGPLCPRARQSGPASRVIACARRH